MRNAGDYMVGGFRVFLDRNGDGWWNRGEIFTRTNELGRYTLSDVPPACTGCASRTSAGGEQRHHEHDDCAAGSGERSDAARPGDQQRGPGRVPSLSGGIPAIRRGDGTMLTALVTTDGPYADFAWVSINDVGGIAFLASTDAGAGPGGIFTGPDPVADKVITIGDALFGGTVQNLLLCNDGLNDAGQIVFRYGLTNGTFGVAVATVPEPAAPLSLALFCAPALLARRRVRGR